MRSLDTLEHVPTHVVVHDEQDLVLSPGGLEVDPRGFLAGIVLKNASLWGRDHERDRCRDHGSEDHFNQAKFHG
ncbi:MAG: hypothetical protein O2816_11285 [Planctomycetota bacterium]|nr:hypothetical protein [Planctomycetota bacterium]